MATRTAVPIGASTRTNLVKNPSFEVSGTWNSGLNGGDGVVTIPSIDQVLFGSHSGKVTFSTHNAFLYQSVPVIPGTTYTYSANVYVASTSNSGRPLISVKDTALNPIGIPDTYGVSVLGVWQQIQVTFQIPQSGVPTGSKTNVELILDFSIAPVAATTFYWDGIMIEALPSLDTYFDGSFTGASWSGAANTSTSILHQPRDIAQFMTAQGSVVRNSAYAVQNAILNKSYM